MTDVLATAATFSKSPRMWSSDPDWEPRQIDFGRGSHVFGSDGREYVDFVSGLGAVLLGYPDPRLRESAANEWANRVGCQVWDGAGFSLPHRLEFETAEKLVALLQAHVPGWDGQPLGLRWGKTGSDATAMAVRLARAVTGRAWVLSVGYHGWHDWAVSTTPPHWGVTQPQYATSVPFGDLETLSRELARLPVAAVIVEQPPQPIPDGYWRGVRRLCDEHGARLILDEVVTGLRVALGGAAERFGIRPDLVCMAKALGNGLPISCIVGPRDLFSWFARRDPVFCSSTSFGESVSLAGASAVLDCWNQEAVDHLWNLGGQLMTGLGEVGIATTGYPPVFLTVWPSEEERAYFILRMSQLGILANRPWIANLSHSLADVEMTVEAARQVKREMAELDLKEVMQGRMPMVLFSGR